VKSEVDQWFASYDNPQKEVLLFLRRAILASDRRIGECIKWKSPTFTYKGNIASFNPRTKSHASLMFHTGASIPGSFPHLEGSGDVARYLKVRDLEQARQLQGELAAIFKAWCEMKDRSGDQELLNQAATELEGAVTRSRRNRSTLLPL